MRILFMGTPDFAVPCLEAVAAQGHEICGVFTQSDKPVGRSFTLTPPPVKVAAQKLGCPVFQPATLKDESVIAQIRALAPELIVVVAYGKILPESVLSIPPRGCINVHGSLLPKYRGSAPIQWSVIRGERVTGVTTMFMDKGIDTGDMIFTQSTEIGPEETSGELYDRLKELGAALLAKTLAAAASGELPRTKQQDELATYAPPLKKMDGLLDFNKPAEELYHLICGLNPWPVAYTTFQGKNLKVYRAAVVTGRSDGHPGQVASADAAGIGVTCGEGSTLLLTEVQGEGGKRMSAADYLRGHPLKPGERLGAE